MDVVRADMVVQAGGRDRGGWRGGKGCRGKEEMETDDLLWRPLTETTD